jgi:hypothetical protein
MVVTVAVGAAGCGGGPGTDRTALSDPVPAPAAPGASEADAVALAVTTAWLSYDTRVDGRPNDTARRLALRFLTPALRRQVSGFVPTTGPGAQWEDWTRRHAHATVGSRLGHDDHPPDSAQVAYRQVVATVTLRGDGGWVLVQRPTLFVELTRIPAASPTPGAWLVSDVRSVDGS